MSADPQIIQQMPKGTFATYIRGLTERAVPMSFPFFILENLPRASKEAIEDIRQQSRQAYAEPWSPTVSRKEPDDDEPPEPPPDVDPSDPLKPSPKL
jgi:hypothetical protein